MSDGFFLDGNHGKNETNVFRRNQNGKIKRKERARNNIGVKKKKEGRDIRKKRTNIGN